ncbi:MAG: AMP-binding protein [Clostridia bacterium]
MTNTRPPSPLGVIEEIPEFDDLKQMMQLCEKNYGAAPAFNLLDKQGTYHIVTYKEFAAQVNQFGTALLSLGLKGEKIAIIGENRYEWCVAYLAVTNGTGIVVPLDKELPDSELANLLNVSEATAIVYSGKLATSIETLAPFVPTLKYLINMDLEASTETIHSFDALCKQGALLISEGVRSFIDAKISNEVMNILLFTSGTTGHAKGVMLSHKNIATDIKAVLACLYLGSEDSILSILPLHHTYECTCGFLVMISVGAKISFCEGIKQIAKNLKETQPSILMLVPLIVENMYKKIWDTAKKTRGKVLKLKVGMFASNALLKTIRKDIRRSIFAPVHESIGGNLRLVISGAAALDPKVAEGFETIGVTVRQGYGLTESSPILSVNQMDRFRHASIGLPMPGIEMKINHPDAQGIGEIIARGDNIMLGYYNNPEATAAVLKDGWLYTGDLGYMDAEGFYYITGRQKNVIVTKNGKNIFPEEVESYLDKSPFIAESLVYGEETRDANGKPTGEITVKASVFPDQTVLEERFAGQTMSEAEIRTLIKNEINHVNKMMPMYKRISDFDIRTTEFEKTTTRKIKRHGANKPV